MQSPRSDTRRITSLEGLEVRRRPSPVALQERVAPNALDQRVRLPVGQRRQAERHVVVHFGIDAAKPERDERPEGRVLREADDRFDAGEHGLHEHRARRAGLSDARGSVRAMSRNAACTAVPS